tara:strand:- start:252 stop:629 length:378 start_codon:yes stop_codon:yes gene_type:complete
MSNFHSKFEKKIANQLDQNQIKYEFEKLIIFYMKTFTEESHYKPDFILDNGIIVEVKGSFNTRDRKKHKLIREQYGKKYDIRFVFSDANKKIGSKSKTSYADWCNIYDFKYAEGKIPQEWIIERR